MFQFQFNSEQQQIINHISGAILVIAPVGTGKTSVLSERVVCAIKNGISAHKILCITFTNRAAQEMNKRLVQACPDEFRYITIKTFHGLCASMLRIEARQIGLPVDFVIYDNEDCQELVKEVFDLSKDKDAPRILSDLATCKTQASAEQLSLNYPLERLFASLEKNKAIGAVRYQAILKERHAIDFADLIFYVRAMFYNYPEIKQRWINRFEFLQVDEVQDTHLSEYEIVSYLASGSRNIAMIGDLDQTIYEWRGSEPEQVINQFTSDFKPTQYSLNLNYRATNTLLKAVSAFADSFQHRQTKITPAPECETGELIQVHVAEDNQQEGKWIAEQIKKLAGSNKNFAYNRVAVLARLNKRVELISEVLEQLDVPCVTREQYQFFMRQEVKDALAYLRFILNPFDTASMYRILMRPRRGIGNATIKSISEEGKNCGFKLTDMALSKTFIDGDPFSELLKAYTSGTIVVFDVETTGFSVSQDEVIEIAATRLIEGKPTVEFHFYIANQVSVGDTESIHGHSDKFLAQSGRDARAVFCEFFDFAEGALLVGHNVRFDIKMVTAHARKVGLDVPEFLWADTWNLANRFIKADSYSLENLAAQLHLPKPNHQATDDTLTTIKLLEYLIPLIAPGEAYRQALVYRYGDQFEELAQQIENWRDASQELRPPEILNRIMIESGLIDFYRSDRKRRQNLQRLLGIFQERDDLAFHPDTSVRSILEFTALAKNLDQISQDKNQVLIVTIHQAKGLEFDTVFIAGVSEREIPYYRSLDEGRLEEEKRLFYVAMTRAKRNLLISANQKNPWGYPAIPSKFIQCIPQELITENTIIISTT
ncbi:MAG: UvrD-helicase domain-containing protein [Symploca sp. SIO3C6]|nr:UvrD-helicase domain-containing protein [Symploca sp. SIO3C6]